MEPAYKPACAPHSLSRKADTGRWPARTPRQSLALSAAASRQVEWLHLAETRAAASSTLASGSAGVTQAWASPLSLWELWQLLSTSRAWRWAPPAPPPSARRWRLACGSAETYQKRLQVHMRYVRQVRLMLYHRGQVDREPDPVRWQKAPAPIGPTRMHQVAERFLVARRLTDRPSTLENLSFTLRRFIAFLAEIAPAIESFAEVEREHVLAFARMLEVEPTARTGRPPSVVTRSSRLSALSSFFRETAAWSWDDVPGRPLLTPGDLPRRPHRMPRYIPADELERLMVAIRALPCPYQRTALLVARWSGARREEIRRLGLDCLDRYPDGTARLRVPAGKTRTERVIPLHEEAADAIRALQAARGSDRGVSDQQTGIVTRYLFVRRVGLLLVLTSVLVRYSSSLGVYRHWSCDQPGCADSERSSLPSHGGHPARRTRREAAHHHAGARSYQCQHDDGVCAHQRPRSVARLPSSTWTRSNDCGSVCGDPPHGRAFGRRDGLAQDELLQN